MSALEIELVGRHGIFARFFATRSANSPHNLFNTESRRQVEGDVTTDIARMDQLVRDELLVEHADHDLLVPMRGRLVLPTSGSEAPLVLILHGNAPALFPPGSARRSAETVSSDGYRTLQRHLASERGIASFSINLNIANTFDRYEDYLLRAEFALLSFMMLRRLAAPYSVGAADEQLFVTQGRAGTLTLADALDRSPPFASGSTLQRLHSLRGSVAGKVDFTKVGLLGHSRGANAALDYPHFLPRGGSAATPTLTRGSGSPINPQLLAHLARLGSLTGGHRAPDVKAIVSLQPADDPQQLASDTTFCLVVASSHDEDTQETASRVYDMLDCPRAMLFVHGATHNRFNEVWRRLPSKVDLMRRNIACQRPIRILSNGSHDDLARHFVAGFFGALVGGQAHELALLSAERRAQIPVDVERAWKFGWPLGPGSVTNLDPRVTSATNTLSGTRTDLAKVNLAESYAPSPFAQTVPVFRVEKPSGSTFRIEIPISDEDQLDKVTHLGFRHAKEYDVANRRARETHPLLNFAIELRAGPALIGRRISGSEFGSLVQRAYPTRQWSHEAGPGGGCYDDTNILLQTVEPTMAQFVAGTRHTVSDLARVDRVRLDLLPATGLAGNDIHVLTDFCLSRRTLPSPP